MARVQEQPDVPATRWSRRFDDFDDMAHHIAAWDVRYEQLSLGHFQADIAISSSPRLQILALVWNRALSNLGAPPQGRRSFAFPLGRRHGFKFSGVTAGDDVVMTGRGGRDFHLVTQGDLHLVIASFDLDLIDARARARFGCDDLPFDEPRLLPGRSTTSLKTAGQALDAIGRAMAHAAPSTLARMESQAADVVLSALAPPASLPDPTPRWRLARRIEEILRSRVADPPGIGELCVIAGVPERTLHLAFRESYGLPPAAYLRRLRLNAARRMLLGEQGVTVTAAAAQFGFFHFGRFSIDYAAMFGEQPSDTLHRAEK
jgi:AraC family transcriptional regulator, ethanolamine operon transcriptional activator